MPLQTCTRGVGVTHFELYLGSQVLHLLPYNVAEKGMVETNNVQDKYRKLQGIVRPRRTSGFLRICRHKEPLQK